MQVSWIDPEEVASLAESLRPPSRAQAPAPPPEPAPEPVQPLVVETTPAQEEAPLPEGPESGIPSPNLAAFRLRLQSIRERAVNAGLLKPKPPAPPPQPLEPAPAATPEIYQAAPPPPAPGPEPTPAPQPVVEMQAPEPEPPATAPVSPPVQVNVPVIAPPPPPHVQIAPGATVKDRLEAFSAWAFQQWGPSDLLIVDEYGDLLWGPPKKSGLVLSTMMAWNAAIRASAQAASGMAQIQRQVLATGENLTIIPCPTRLGMLQIAVVKAQAPWDEETALLKEALVQLMDFPG